MREKLLVILNEIRPDVDFIGVKGLLSEGILDSFDFIKIISAISNELGITIDPMDVTLDKFDSFDDILHLIENQK